MIRSMLEALRADGPHPDHAEELALFGRFVGAWAVDNAYLHEGGEERYEAEWRFGWTLDGRAVQDVLFNPPASKADGTRAHSQHIGTTVRLFQPATGDWTVIWFSATRGNVATLRGRPDGDDIEIVGETRRGDALRWRFSEIADESFRWHGFIRPRDGGDWRLEQEMLARRLS